MEMHRNRYLGDFVNGYPITQTNNCKKCSAVTYGRDEWFCRHCDPVEKINTLIEQALDELFKLYSDYILGDEDRIGWGYDEKELEGKISAYIEAADIIMESE